MKISCEKSDLLNGVNIVSKAVPSKTTMSILECILIDTTKGDIKLTANDTEIGIETKIKGEIIESGIIAIDAKLFLDIVRKLPDNKVIIETDNNNFVTTITCEKAKFNIPGKSGDEYTRLPNVKKSDYINISQFTLKEIIRQTIFSISDNDNNKLMTGELFDIKGDELKVVALDGHRIAVRKIKLNQTYSDNKVVVPGKTLIEISKILSGDTESRVNIFITEKNIVFEFDNTIVVSRLIEGDYFNIDQMISNDYSIKLKVNKKEFYNSIDRSTLLVKEGDKKPIIVGINDEYMELKINSTLGSLNETINIEKEGNDILIGFNPKFLMDALRVIDDETISMYMVNPKAPCFIRNEDDSYLYLILPVNFNNVG